MLTDVPALVSEGDTLHTVSWAKEMGKPGLFPNSYMGNYFQRLSQKLQRSDIRASKIQEGGGRCKTRVEKLQLMKPLNTKEGQLKQKEELMKENSSTNHCDVRSHSVSLAKSFSWHPWSCGTCLVPFPSCPGFAHLSPVLVIKLCACLWLGHNDFLHNNLALCSGLFGLLVQVLGGCCC